MKRLVTIQDISCVGKCSLTVALPVISAMGTETAVIPTAVLSAHTAFEGFTLRDLTDEIKPVARHWKEQGLEFSCIYTGYLASEGQIDAVEEFIRDFRREKDTLVFVDPVMGDSGRLYSGFARAFARKMAKLCGKADIIVPNITEACCLLDIPYTENPTREELKDILRRLCELGAKNAVVTGVTPRPGEIGVMAYSSEKDSFFEYCAKKADASFHGTGDVFASACAGALCRGMEPEEALRLAVDFTSLCAELTLSDPERRWYGISFERALPWLTRRLEETDF